MTITRATSAEQQGKRTMKQKRGAGESDAQMQRGLPLESEMGVKYVGRSESTQPEMPSLMRMWIGGAHKRFSCSCWCRDKLVCTEIGPTAVSTSNDLLMMIPLPRP